MRATRLLLGKVQIKKNTNLNLVPSGIIREGIECYIGNGVVLDINHLSNEVEGLEKNGITVKRKASCQCGLPFDP